MALTTAGPGWCRWFPIAAAAIMLVSTAGCTDGEDTEPEVTTTSGPRPEWCDVLEALDLPEDAPDVELTDAPMELQLSLHFIAENEAAIDAMREAGERTEVETAGAVESRTTVEAWGHEHCGTPDPFCSLWTSLTGMFAAGPTESPLEFVVETLDDELIQYAPDGHLDAVKDHLVDLYASLGTPVPSDYEEGDAEAAYEELDEWVGSHC